MIYNQNKVEILRQRYPEGTRICVDGTVVDTELLKASGIIKKELDGVKILGNGELTKNLTVKAAKFSAAAKEKIEKAGGKVEVM